MAGDWIKMRSNLAEDPAVICIAGKVGLDEFAVVGRLQHLWAWFDAQSRDGHAHGVTAAWVNRKVQRDGFAEAMADAGWLILHDDGIEMPKFDRHNGDSAKDRAQGTKRKQNQRSKEAGPAHVTQESRDMSRNQRDKNETREEKRREEKEDSLPTGFAEFWSAYPNRKAKQDAVKAWRKLNPSDALQASILKAIAEQGQGEDWRKEGGRFVPHAATWLNGKRWLDEVGATDPAGADMFAGGV